MSAALALTRDTIPGPDAATVAAARGAVERELLPLAGAIDREALYPEAVLRAMGATGAFARHCPDGAGQEIDLATTVASIAVAGEACGSTAFCAWCQSALAWYVWCSDNAGLKARLGPALARGEILGGTGLSNPMKTFFGIETMRLKGRRIEGGYEVSGALPWVSNLGPDHWFAIVFKRDDGRPVMAAMSCAAPGVKLVDGGEFVALNGTRTYGIQLRNCIVPDDDVLADPAEPYVARIRGGFVLLQIGMGLGLARSCTRLIREVEGPLGHVNRFLDVQAEDLEERADELARRTFSLAPFAYEADAEVWRGIVQARLDGSELALAAAQAAMLHCGARGYGVNAEAQRRVRESYFVAIVTPAIKQLRKMLADMPG